MNTTILFMYFFEMIGTTAIFYGLAWLVMRPKDGRKVPHPFLWHLYGILLTNICAIIFRIVAMFAFAGKSALTGDDSAYIYVIIMPALFAAIYITWLKNKAA